MMDTTGLICFLPISGKNAEILKKHQWSKAGRVQCYKTAGPHVLILFMTIPLEVSCLSTANSVYVTSPSMQEPLYPDLPFP